MKMIFAAMPAMVLIACGSTEEDGGIDIEACELIVKTASPLTATSDRATAPAVTPGETPYELTLSATDKTYFSVTVAAAGEYALFLNQDNVATAKYFSGTTEKMLEAGSANEPCAGVIPDHYHVPLDAAGTFAFELNPSASKVTIVFHPDEGEHVE